MAKHSQEKLDFLDLLYYLIISIFLKYLFMPPLHSPEYFRGGDEESSFDINTFRRDLPWQAKLFVEAFAEKFRKAKNLKRPEDVREALEVLREQIESFLLGRKPLSPQIPEQTPKDFAVFRAQVMATEPHRRAGFLDSAIADGSFVNNLTGDALEDLIVEALPYSQGGNKQVSTLLSSLKGRRKNFEHRAIEDDLTFKLLQTDGQIRREIRDLQRVDDIRFDTWSQIADVFRDTSTKEPRALEA